MDLRKKMRILLPWISAAVAVFSLILLIVIGITQVQPYNETRGFKSANCQLSNITYRDSRKCDRSPGALGSYECVVVKVFYPDLGNSSIYVLYDTEKELKESHCSYIPRICSVHNEENIAQVNTFEKSFEADKTFSCLRDPEAYSRVIRRRDVSNGRAIHMLLWPTFFLIVSIIIAIWGMAKTPRRSTISYIEVEHEAPNRPIYRRRSKDDIFQ